jgi:hypothetical protein
MPVARGFVVQEDRQRQRVPRQTKNEGRMLEMAMVVHLSKIDWRPRLVLKTGTE